jgi:hypothetical protein
VRCSLAITGENATTHSPSIADRSIWALMGGRPRTTACRPLRQKPKQLVTTKSSIHDLTGLGVDPVHLEHSLCNVQSICRSIHFGPSVPPVVDQHFHFGTSMPFGPGGPLPHCLALHPRREGGVHSISVGWRRLTSCPSRRGRCRPHPSLTPPCRFPAVGSSGTTHEARQACVMRGRNKG